MQSPSLCLSVALAASLAVLAPTPRAGDDAPNTSGLPLPPEEAAYDVLHYELTVRVDPTARAIRGRLVMRARLVQGVDSILLDLDPALDVDSIDLDGKPADWEREDGRLRIRGARFAHAGGEFAVGVAYGGTPRVAPNPPWRGGFTWSETPSGQPWIATTCQMEGADLWWPCKDQPSDEPDSFDLFVTVPEDLVDASNGRLVSVDAAEDGWHTYHWHVSTPIENYCIALDIAPYVTIEKKYTSVAGDTFPVTYWVLPENEEKGHALVEEMLADMRFFEELFGPYPFRADKFGVVETPHLGMEHQSIIAYGNAYHGNPWGKQRGFDFLLHHESAHEWWANLVTARDWKDFWIHEGFATYAQALYVERLHGWEAYLEQMAADRRRIQNRGAVAPRDTRTTDEMYFSGRPDAPDQDIYYKGSWFLHTLRWVLGDEVFFRGLRRMAYPDPALEKTTDGSACRFTSTDEIRAIAEKTSGMELGWMFDVYLRQPELPRLVAEAEGTELHLSWQVPDDLPFPMPVPLRVGKDVLRVEVPAEGAVVHLPPTARDDWEVDPEDRVLKAEGR